MDVALFNFGELMKYLLSRKTFIKGFCSLLLLLVISLQYVNAQNKKFSQLIEEIKPAVISVIPCDEKGNSIGEGSGFFIDSDILITNYHVIDGASLVKIKFNDQNVYTVAGFLSVDYEWDLVLLKVTLPSTRKIKPLKLAKKYPKTGEKIFVIGNPLGFEQTVSDGIISSIRPIEGKGNYLQITAPISPGNSGSPVLTLDGLVSGVASFYYEEGQSLNFAVPFERIETLVPGSLQEISKLKKSTTSEKENNNVLDEHQVKSNEDQNFESNVVKISRAMDLCGWIGDSLTESDFEKIWEKMDELYPGFSAFKHKLSGKQALNIINNVYGKNPDTELHYRKDGTSIYYILNDVNNLISEIEDSSLDEVVRVECDIIFTSNESYRYLSDKWTYNIIVIGDDRKIKDLSLKAYILQDDEWKKVSSENEEGPYAMLEITPKKYGFYKFVITVDEYNQGYEGAHYTLIISHE
ncbi:serine protease [Bacteroidetes/Chlorobi group bacterium ChocPot_Mid]|jgi:hypothetical protein|nr:MAG: serine protease [Bacteroidetes/Chlorobi group bacterium ChocPot_Mid]